MRSSARLGMGRMHGYIYLRQGNQAIDRVSPAVVIGKVTHSGVGVPSDRPWPYLHSSVCVWLVDALDCVDWLALLSTKQL
jgi:hypothetical protein